MWCGYKNVSFAYIFKHCGLKTSDFKPSKFNQQWKRSHFAICTCFLRVHFWARSERRAHVKTVLKVWKYWSTELFLLLYMPWMVKYALVCVKTPVFASIIMNRDLGLSLKRTAEKENVYQYTGSRQLLKWPQSVIQVNQTTKERKSLTALD